MPWRDLLQRFGDFRVVHTRWSRWSKTGVWERVIELLEAQGKTAVIGPKRNRKQQRQYDEELYKARHLIENFFAKLKQYRAIATRYDKRGVNFLGAIYLAALVIWLN